MKRTLIIIFICLIYFNNYAQLKTKYFPTSKLLRWTYEISDTLEQPQFYMVFSCQGNDTTLFPLIENASYDDVWDWWIGSCLYEYFYVQLKPIELGKHIRLGVMVVGWNGEKLPLTVAPIITLYKYPKIKWLD